MVMKPSTYNLDDLNFYFDSQLRDQMDVGKLGFRIGKFTEIKKKLLTLSDNDFEAVVTIMEQVVESYEHKKKPKNKKVKITQDREVLEVFQRVSNYATSGIEQVSGI